MAELTLPVAIRWADLDPNFHVRHSVYYDFGASARMEFLLHCGLTPSVMAQIHVGPILFREEAVFRRELRYGDALTISTSVTKARRDFSRFSFRHSIRREDGTVCAEINVDGAWIDTQVRKLGVPPQQVAQAFEQGPKSDDFVWLD
jgi:acyl-CoA thioester hydrolase